MGLLLGFAGRILIASSVGVAEVIDPDFWWYYLNACELRQWWLLEVVCSCLGRLSAALGVSCVLALKVLAVLLSFLAATSTYLLARELVDDRAAVWAFFLYLTTVFPLEYGSGLSLRHDSLLLPLCVLTSVSLIKLLDSKGKLPYALIFPVMSALCFATNRFTASLVLIPTFTYLYWAALRRVLSSEGRFRLPLLALLIAAGASSFLIAVKEFLVPAFRSARATVSLVSELSPPGIHEHLRFLNILLVLAPIGLAIYYRRRSELKHSLLLYLWLFFFLVIYLSYLRGLVYFYVPLVILAAIPLSKLRWKESLLVCSIVFFFSLVAVEGVLPTVIWVYGTTSDEYEACRWIAEHAPGSRVLASWSKDYLIMAVARSKPVYNEVNKHSFASKFVDLLLSESEDEFIKKARKYKIDFVLVHSRLLVIHEHGLTTTLPPVSKALNMTLPSVAETVLFKMIYAPEKLTRIKLVYEVGYTKVYEVEAKRSG
ncbi:MAG: hypothetical protein DRN99_08050 [Thermoproteota archaeon]|nr:MAG: hypothetical protein DRN99_08050 [Candidatus Korarchaeota archaeon]